MNVIKYELFDNAAEAVSFKKGKSNTLRIELSEELDGFVTIGNVTVRLRSGIATLDLRLIDDGDHNPILILKNGRQALPGISKHGRSLELADCGAEYLRDLSMRERELSKRVLKLEESIEKLSTAIFGTTLF